MEMYENIGKIKEIWEIIATVTSYLPFQLFLSKLLSQVIFRYAPSEHFCSESMPKFFLFVLFA